MCLIGWFAWMESPLFCAGNFTTFETIRRTRGKRYFSAGEMAGAPDSGRWGMRPVARMDGAHKRKGLVAPGGSRRHPPPSSGCSRVKICLSLSPCWRRDRHPSGTTVAGIGEVGVGDMWKCSCSIGSDRDMDQWISHLIRQECPRETWHLAR